MADWPRTILPMNVSPPSFPGGLDSWGHSGKGQFRSVLAVGRTWEETYPPLRVTEEDEREFLAIINKYWRERTVFDIDHRQYLTPNGAGGGTPKIKGGGQTGSSIATDGWPASTLVLKAGDIISIDGVPYVLDITEDATSDSGGNATLKISPPIFSGGSPADDADITCTGVKFACVIVNRPNIPKARPSHIIAGLTLVFREAIS